MRYRPLGRTGLRASEIGFGAWAIGGNAHGNSYGPTDDGESLRAIGRAVELGVTFFDTADVYGWGHSEALLGEALGGIRDDVVLATKVGGDFYHGGVRMNFSPDYLPFALERSLRRLRTDRVDLWQLHNPPLDILDDERLLRVLEVLRAEGKVLHIGISVHEPHEALAAIASGAFETIQIPFNLLRVEWREAVLPAAGEAGVGVIAREPLANGFLTGKYDARATFPPGDIRSLWPPAMVAAYAAAARRLAFLARPGRTLAQAALQFVLAHPEVSTAIAGAKTPAQVEENAAASEGRLTTEELARIEALRRAAFGPGGQA